MAADARVEDVRARLREAPHSYFLGGDGAIVTSEPVLLGGEWWATAIDRASLEALVSVSDVLSVDRCRVMAIDGPLDATALAPAARAAASKAIIDPLAIDPLADVRREHGRRRRLRLLSAMLLLGLTTSTVGPMLLHASFAKRERTMLASLQMTVNESHAWARATAAQRLDDETRLAVLARRAPLRTPLISSLGSVLPDSAVVMSLAIDSTTGTVVVLAPPGVDVLSAVSQVANITDARLGGAVTRERLLERDVNRTTIAFRILSAEESP